MRGINGGNLITPIVSSFHVCFSPKVKMEKLIFGGSGEKMSWLTKNPLTFLSLPNKPKSYFLSFFSIFPLPTKGSLTFPHTLTLEFGPTTKQREKNYIFEKVDKNFVVIDLLEKKKMSSPMLQGFPCSYKLK